VHSLVLNRTTELERIHATGIILRQLRQFAHSLAQLEHYVNDQSIGQRDGKDIRHYNSAAKTLHELEQLIEIPQLQQVQLVVDHTSSIRAFGKQLREAAKDRLLVALRDRNQATVADCLQVCSSHSKAIFPNPRWTYNYADILQFKFAARNSAPGS
jgi:hypothetical protein